MIRDVFIFLFCVLINYSIIVAQNSSGVVAKVGTEEITANDFKIRFELSPYIPANKNIDPDSLKYDFLYSLIAEKLWALEAEKNGFAKTDDFEFYFKPLQDIYIRDALFKQEIKDHVVLSANDVTNAINKLQVKLKAQIISNKDSALIFSFFNLIKHSTNIDSFLNKNTNFNVTETEITLGKLRDEEIEDSLYSLGIGEITEPIKSEVGWVIFRVTDKVFSPVDISNSKVTGDMKDIIRNRRIEKKYRQYLNELLKGITIDIEPEAFSLVYNALLERLIENKSNLLSEKFFYELTENDFKVILKKLGKKNTSKKFFRIYNKEISIFDFLASLAFDGFSTTSLDKKSIQEKVNNKAKQFVENQLLSYEGYKKGLHLNQDVVNELNNWKINYLAQMYFLTVRDSVILTESEIYKYYQDEIISSSKIKMVNMRLVMLNDLGEVEKILKEINEGRNFGEVIKRYGQTDSLVNHLGETGLQPVMLFGDIGKIVEGLKLNEVYGPIKRGNSYCVFQVIDEEFSGDSLKLSYETAKDQIKNTIRDKKLIDKLNKHTSNLAEKYGVQINPSVLDKIETTQIPMFVHRLMGFGGRIAGVPLLTPFSSWINGGIKSKMLP